MKFSFGAVLAFAAAVLAVPQFTNSNFDVEEGEPFTLTWNNAEGPVTITLVHGPEKNLKPVTVLTTTGSDGSFTWTPSDLPSDTYAFEIIDDTGVKNWSKRFEYTGTGSVTSTETPTSTAESSTSTEASSTTTSSSSSETESTTTSEEASSTTFTTSTTEEAETSTRATTTPTGSPPDLNNGQRFASPLGFVLVTVAALVFFN
ncbi:Ser-Thr-rich glycosyl-phosphatidyl-inositol-anchored membrane family-domain-containing protein [Chaetomium tenue]|uniref:Ser-Thr-rich glycosyl-phosphatidyl-inositol-anchored membrane family-domain-containing protein n=1 Tax=Chaetomium tenue TaxID=1854479 RepID=A0ACB7PRQ4_9PEZI|nr:Ser-Thr-rich glycosyl-phosphatidyl-inositol-anchored membrane family-domain-containing protein [Chaetomium globosum]